MKSIIGSAVIVCALLLPVALPAQEGEIQQHERERQRQDQQRYYDQQSKDWHQWNGDENKAWQRYQQEHHRNDRDFGKLSKREREEYFKWRHQHPDEHHPDERR